MARANLIRDRGTASVPLSSKGADFSIDEYYKILLTVGVQNATVFEGWLDEEFAISMGAQYTAPLDKTTAENLAPVFGNAIAGLGDLLSKATGIQGKVKQQTIQVWESSSPISLQVPMIFIAQKSAKKDVTDKVKALQKLVAPSTIGDSILRAPGMTPLQWKNDDFSNRISLSIGRMIQLENVILKDVDAQFSSMPAKDGSMIMCRCNLTVESLFACFTAEDIERMYI